MGSRESLLAYARLHRIPVEAQSGTKPPYSMDANLLHISYEGGVLEDPWVEPEDHMWRMTVSPERAADEPRYVDLGFERGDPVVLDGQRLSPGAMLAALNRVAGPHGIGRLDLVENRYVGMKSRGSTRRRGTVLLKAHRAIESLTLDREVAHLKDELMPRYASLIYNGYWFSPERRMLQEMIDASQARVNGVVRLKLYKGNVIVAGRRSDTDSLFDPSIATFEDDQGAYDQRDAGGFIKLNALGCGSRRGADRAGPKGSGLGLLLEERLGERKIDILVHHAGIGSDPRTHLPRGPRNGGPPMTEKLRLAAARGV